MTRFKIIINCGPCQDFIGKCLASIKEQSLPHWEAYVTVDPCGDQTYARALLAAGDPRIHVRRNQTRRHSMYNIVHAIRRSEAEPEDVIATLDGDDWFADRDALRLIANAYEKTGCWITYGSWLSNVVGPSGRRDGLWPAYPDGTVDFRRNRFLGTAVRTWKKWLWDHLDDADLRSDTGEYVRVSEDQMIMIPLLEMAGTSRAKHIAVPIMIYNKLVKYAPDDAITEEGMRNGYLIDRRAPYARLENKVRAGMAAATG
ncbi:MAG TPA: glycosyltransferase family A protein [Bryobacteraceae bacterium]|nr:glycosyltransferase family A protein [Bryobacteraceae bacterium]